MANSSASLALPYQEPDIATILINGAFLLLLNTINHVLDRLICCGLVGELFIGIAWGAPGAQWLSTTAETIIVQLGYLGLILIVYEGGLSTSAASIRRNAHLSVAVALTGVSVPVALSFVLQRLSGATAVQAFAAGAALCSTSLGTTFTVLSANNMAQTRLGSVLSNAAMLDDVIGLVMVQVISSLGDASLDAVTIIRPVFVSLGFIIVTLSTCAFVLRPVGVWISSIAQKDSRLFAAFASTQVAVTLHSLFLFGLVAAASYAGTSNLLAAYLAGATISWWDQCTNSKSQGSTTSVDQTTTADDDESDPPATHLATAETVPTMHSNASTGMEIYDTYFKRPVERILKPFFFASIGFSIPITRLFEGPIVWRGIIYALLMTVGKLVCGLWLVRPNVSLKTPTIVPRFLNSIRRQSRRVWPMRPSARPEEHSMSRPTDGQPTLREAPDTPKPVSLYPACILGLAMVARGEIGFLISSIALSDGVFGSSGSNTSTPDIFLVVTWAIVLCTILGPLGVGLLVRRVRRLDKSHQNVIPLGVWGVQ